MACSFEKINDHVLLFLSNLWINSSKIGPVPGLSCEQLVVLPQTREKPLRPTGCFSIEHARVQKPHKLWSYSEPRAESIVLG